MKLRKLHIDNYKMFKNFDINFMDKENNNNPLDIIVLAGVNGSGKTTLFEYLLKLPVNENTYKISYIKNNKNFDYIYNKKLVLDGGSLDDNNPFEREEFIDNLIYFSTDKGLEDIKEFLPKYIEKMVYEEDIVASKIYKRVKEEINKIFNGFNLKIEFDSRDGEGNLFFRNENKEKISIDDLSTGEKTLLSKILYLYIKNIKNKVILIDEPELSLHPAWQNRVLKLYENFAKENNCQIIIATHSPHIIGSAKSEYIRLLIEDGVVDNFSNTYGAKVSQILTEVMGAELRDSEINEKLSVIKKMIANNEFDSEEFIEKWKKLEDMLGKSYFDLNLLKLEIASRRKDVQNNKK